MLETIISTLKGTARADVFCTKVTVTHKDFSMSVNPLGPVKFPISARSAKELILEAEPAKFGKGEKTLVDRRVRDVWEIPKSRVKISKNDWGKRFESALQKIRKDLELPEDGKLSAELHNLLIYGPGQFFKGHQDSEKSEGMVATLVVLLPSEFSGGSLVIDQHGDKQRFKAPRNIEDDFTFIAFYSDCHHEVMKVTAGYRVALTYNLIFKTPSKSLPLQQNERLEKELEGYFSTADIGGIRSYESKRPRWFVYLLDHQYTQKSLSWQTLKGADRRRAAELLSCADKIGLKAHLALADIHETWSTEDEGSWGRYGGYSNDEEEDDESEMERDLDEHELAELIEDDFELRHWVDRSDRQVRMKESSVPRGMVCWTKAVDEFKPFNTEYEGYMGNYGNTLDRWYHRAAIVLWKQDSEYANLFASDSVVALKKISALLKKNLPAGRVAIQQVLPQWPQQNDASLNASLVFEISSLTQDNEIASKLLAPMQLGSLSGSKNRLQFLKLIDTFGEKWCLEILQTWGKSKRWSPSDTIKDLVPLVRALSHRYRTISSWILENRLAHAKSADKGEDRSSSLREIKRNLNARMKSTADLMNAATVAEEFEIQRKFAGHVLSYPRLYPAIEMVKLLKSIKISWKGDVAEKWGIREILDQLKNRLQAELSTKRKKGDWSIRETLPHDCADCKQLKKFLFSETEPKLIWPLAKERRRHIHGIIDGMDIPVTHATLRMGSPQKLVLTKTPAIFERDIAQRKASEAALATLKGFA